MIKEYLNVIVVEKDEGNQIFFKNIFEELKIKTKVLFFSKGQEVVDYLMNKETHIPEILFMNYDMEGEKSFELIDEMKENFGSCKMTTVLYSELLSEPEIEEIFVKGVNVFMKMPENYTKICVRNNHCKLAVSHIWA
jgi:CheY-like chemotaxis protein